MSTTMTTAENELDTATLDRYREQAGEALSASVAALEAAGGAGPDAAELGTYPATGSASFATAGIWGNMTVQLQFAGGPSMKFYGEHWGLGLAGGISWGAALFSVPPAALVGGGHYTVAAVAGAVTVTFFKNGQAVGAFHGAGLSVGAMFVSGWGNWTYM